MTKTRKYVVRRIPGTRPGLEGAKVYSVRHLDDDWEHPDDTRTALVYLHGDCGQFLTCERCQVDDRLYPACGHIGAMQKFLLLERGKTT